MKRVKIIQHNGQPTYSEQEDPTQWIADCIASNAWGKPERSVPASADFDEADVVERYDHVVTPAVPAELISEAIPGTPAVMDDAGNIVQEEIPAVPAVYSEEIPAVTVPMVKLRAEYTIEIEDIADKVAQEKTNAEALAYLASTDWMVIREIDAGIVCPEDVKLARAEARSKIVRMD